VKGRPEDRHVLAHHGEGLAHVEAEGVDHRGPVAQPDAEPEAAA
jgi:hypothetical protein